MAVAATIAAGALLVARAAGPPRWLGLVLIGVALHWGAAAWASKVVLRMVALVAILSTVLGLVHVGADAAVARERASREAVVAMREAARAKALAAAEQAPADRRRRAAVEAADAALEEAKDQLDDPVELEARELVVRGADHVVEEALEPIAGEEDEVAAGLGGLGWVVLAVLALVWYRLLEIRNNHRYGAPVAVSPIAVSDGDEKRSAYMKDRLASNVTRSELYEPPSLPGGKHWDEVTTTLKEESLPGAKGVATALRLVRHVAFPPAGITASGSCVVMEPAPGRGPAAAAPASTEKAETSAKKRDEGTQTLDLTVTLTTTRDGRFLRSERFTGPPERVLGEAGDFIAADVLTFSILTPPWAKSWGERGRAFRIFREGTGELPDKDQLRGALRLGPANGFLRALLASAYELDGELTEALRLNLVNRIDYPRFLQGRYRFVTSLSMLASPRVLDTQWWGSDNRVRRDEIVTRLQAAGLLTGVNASWPWLPKALRSGSADPAKLLGANRPTTDNDERAAARMLLAIAWRELRHLRWLIAAGGLPGSLWRQGERAQWFELLRHGDRRRRWLGQVRSVRRIIKSRAFDLDDSPRQWSKQRRRLTRRVNADVARPSAPTAVLYNAACYFALAPARESGPEGAWEPDPKGRGRALELLDRAVRSASGPVPSAKWLRRDPDLELLRDDERFRRVLGWLEREERREI